MDIDALTTHARARFDHAVARQVLKEKYQAKMLFAHNGGMFCADQNLMVLLQAIPTEEAVILDLYENPIRVNTVELGYQVGERFQEVMNAWQVEYEEISKKR
jgi:hypothetical protein